VQRDTKRTKRRLEKSKETEESKKIKKDEKLLNTYMREERKLFLGGQSPRQNSFSFFLGLISE
jgi:hypothetical protein